MSSLGYLATPWPCEDGGPARLQAASTITKGLAIQPGEHLQCTTRLTLLSTMTVLGPKGQVYLLSHSALRSHVGLPTTAEVERIDPFTLKPVMRSGRLAGGPMWPGGMALHRNGDLIVVYGRYAHRLNQNCERLVSHRLPVDEPYNSFVILDNGLIVTKNLSETTPARLSVLDPVTLQPVGPDLIAPEPSIARLSAVGNTVVMVGVQSVMRFDWDESRACLRKDEDWQCGYLAHNVQTYGWDVVLDGEQAWWMDNGKHRYRWSMLGAGVSHAPNRLHRVAWRDSRDHQSWPISGLAGGSVTNPPLRDVKRGIVVAFDSANAVLVAWRLAANGEILGPLWRKQPFGCASHMVLFADTAELVVNDYRRHGEEVVVLDIETGTEKARVRVGGITQGVVFPSAGWHRDVYWSSMGRLSRVFVEGAPACP